LSEIIS